MILVLCVIAILCSNNPGAVPELQTYGLTSYQTVITIVKHIMEKLRYKDSAVAEVNEPSSLYWLQEFTGR